METVTLTKDQLATIHHALRMLAKYPGVVGAELREVNETADLIWESVFCRYEDFGRPEAFELTPSR